METKPGSSGWQHKQWWDWWVTLFIRDWDWDCIELKWNLLYSEHILFCNKATKDQVW